MTSIPCRTTQFELCRHKQRQIMGSISSPKRAEILTMSKYQLYANHRNTQYIKVSVVRNPSKFLVYQRSNGTRTIEILSISNDQQYTTHQNTQCTKVSIVRNPWKYLTYQSINGTQPIEILCIPSYLQYAAHRNTKFCLVHWSSVWQCPRYDVHLDIRTT